MGLNQVLDFATFLCWVFLLALLLIAAKASSALHSDQITWSLSGEPTDLHFFTYNKAFLNYLLSSRGFLFQTTIILPDFSMISLPPPLPHLHPILNAFNIHFKKSYLVKLSVRSSMM